MNIGTTAMTIFLCASPALAQPPVPESVDASEIPNYSKVDDRIAAGGQPATDAPLRELGFDTIVNLRTAEEGADEERARVEAIGLRYVATPVRGSSFSSADVDAVAAALEDPEAGNVLVHCASSNRVGAVFAVIAARRGDDVESALAHGARHGLRSESLIATVRRILAAERVDR